MNEENFKKSLSILTCFNILLFCLGIPQLLKSLGHKKLKKIDFIDFRIKKVQLDLVMSNHRNFSTLVKNYY